MAPTNRLVTWRRYKGEGRKEFPLGFFGRAPGFAITLGCHLLLPVQRLQPSSSDLSAFQCRYLGFQQCSSVSSTSSNFNWMFWLSSIQIAILHSSTPPSGSVSLFVQYTISYCIIWYYCIKCYWSPDWYTFRQVLSKQLVCLYADEQGSDPKWLICKRSSSFILKAQMKSGFCYVAKIVFTTLTASEESINPAFMELQVQGPGVCLQFLWRFLTVAEEICLHLLLRHHSPFQLCLALALQEAPCLTLCSCFPSSQWTQLKAVLRTFLLHSVLEAIAPLGCWRFLSLASLSWSVKFLETFP